MTNYCNYKHPSTVYLHGNEKLGGQWCLDDVAENREVHITRQGQGTGTLPCSTVPVPTLLAGNALFSP